LTLRARVMGEQLELLDADDNLRARFEARYMK
jgi:hypothetical protein